MKENSKRCCAAQLSSQMLQRALSSYKSRHCAPRSLQQTAALTQPACALHLIFCKNSPSPAGATKAEAAAKHRARMTALKERAMVLVEGGVESLGLTLGCESAKSETFNNHPFSSTYI
jgi:hypothetical protein